MLAAIVLLGATGSARAHVQLDAPNGGEMLQPGDQFTIRWRILIAHALENWDLWYSTTGPSGPWTLIRRNLPPGSAAVGSIHTYNWTIPDAPSTRVRVRVRMDNTGQDYFDRSDANLTIEATVPVDRSTWGRIKALYN